ncbi:MAG: efflux RND transporter periplasmic adaptor subunit [Polyangia bacterium]
MATHADAFPLPGSDARRIRTVLAGGIGLALILVIGLYFRATHQTNHVALSQAPKPVSVVNAQSTTFRPVHSYVGTINAWNTAKVGPQYVSAYIGTVLVRPGSVVKKGQVLATLDCRNTSAASHVIAARAKALEARQAAVEHETERTKELTAGGFASANEVEQLSARSASEEAEVESLRASLVSRGIEVDDCILRAPFDGEIADRYADPGAYVRPGNPVVTVIDRRKVRISGDVPESDFTVVAPDTSVKIEVQASGAKMEAKISRRAPSADESTRTVHFEIDVANADLALPTGTTARLTIAVGTARPATSVPLQAASVRGDKASLFVVDGDIAKRVTIPVLGEQAGTLFLDPKLAAGTRVVVEGRALLDDKDRVAAKEFKL